MDDAMLDSGYVFSELPDAGVDLFQKSHDSFTLFPKLQVEIRLKIWRKAFPPSRPVSLDIPGYAFEAPFNQNQLISEMYRESLKLRSRPRIPVTSRVNRESREETLRHYTVIFPRDVLSDLLHPINKFKEKPICFNPCRDRFRFDHEIVRLCYKLFGRWLDCIAERIPLHKGLENVHYLEVNVWWRALFMERYGLQNVSEFFSIIQRFEGLKELHIGLGKLDVKNPFTLLLVYQNKFKSYEYERFFPRIQQHKENQTLYDRLGNKEEWLRRLFNVETTRFGVGKAPSIVLRVPGPVPRMWASDGVWASGNKYKLCWETFEMCSEEWWEPGERTRVLRFPRPPGVDSVVNPLDWSPEGYYVDYLISREKMFLESSGIQFDCYYEIPDDYSYSWQHRWADIASENFREFGGNLAEASTESIRYTPFLDYVSTSNYRSYNPAIWPNRSSL